MCQGAAERLLNSSEHCQVRKVASLLARALTHTSPETSGSPLLSVQRKRAAASFVNFNPSVCLSSCVGYARGTDAKNWSVLTMIHSNALFVVLARKPPPALPPRYDARTLVGKNTEANAMA